MLLQGVVKSLCMNLIKNALQEQYTHAIQGQVCLCETDWCETHMKEMTRRRDRRDSTWPER